MTVNMKPSTSSARAGRGNIAPDAAGGLGFADDAELDFLHSGVFFRDEAAERRLKVVVAHGDGVAKNVGNLRMAVTPFKVGGNKYAEFFEGIGGFFDGGVHVGFEQCRVSG